MGANQGPKETFKMSTLLVENVTPVVSPVEEIVLDAAKELVEFRKQVRNNSYNNLIKDLCERVLLQAKAEIEKDPFKKWSVTSFGIMDFKTVEEFDLTYHMLESINKEELRKLLSPYFSDVELRLNSGVTFQITVTYKD